MARPRKHLSPKQKAANPSCQGGGLRGEQDAQAPSAHAGPRGANNKLEGGILRARPGHGANCSSLGSSVDLLFGLGALSAGLLLVVQALVDEAQVGATRPEGETGASSEPNPPAEGSADGDPTKG